jgi:hypothetical protein
MRQVLILAFLIAIAMASPMGKNCSSVPEPSMSTNYYMPPKSCVDGDAAIRGCMTSFSDCLKAAPGCEGINACFAGRILCLIGTTPTSANCTEYAAGLDNAGLYLAAGGSYNGSTLEHACEWGICHAAMEAFDHGVKANGTEVCPVDMHTICAPPNFEPPTRSPAQAEYAVTFGGNYAAILADAPKNSAKYKQLEVAVGKGLAKLLGVLEHYIAITDMYIGSLVVKFVVNDATVDVATVTQQLQKVKDDPTLAASTFTELAAETGITIEVTGVATELPTPVPATLAPGQTWAPTPVPETPAPDAGTPAPTASAGLVSAAAAVVAVLAMMF